MDKTEKQKRIEELHREITKLHCDMKAARLAIGTTISGDWERMKRLHKELGDLVHS